ncbi:ExbD/TolR family protein [Pseudoalteromonas piscicida]|uniref:Uncharacterized protein n=1 Tax=Pseudoalteromonas piscicida TaxID=43662 RepID=A0A2A5JMS8_PSEO7|nr:hypothetical protein [Pseudoalteromonas piscicida]PCK30736.1 hypothetical protein CEX98_15800 [Pseudoalteromonas piscicida]
MKLENELGLSSIYIDLSFVLLIFFVLILPLQRESAISVIKGSSVEKCGQFANWCSNNAPIKIAIENDGTVSFFPFGGKVIFDINDVTELNKYVYNLQGKFEAEYAWVYIAENVPVKNSISVSSLLNEKWSSPYCLG